MTTQYGNIDLLWNYFEKQFTESFKLNIYDMTDKNKPHRFIEDLTVNDFYFQRIGTELVMLFSNHKNLSVPLKERYTYSKKKEIIRIYTKNDLMYELDFSVPEEEKVK